MKRDVTCRSVCDGVDPFMDTLTSRTAGELACWISDAPIAMPPSCEEGPRAPRFSTGHDASYSGPARMLDPSFALALANGSTLTMSASDLEYPPLSVGSTVAVELSIDCPFWCNQSLVLRTEQGALLFAAWIGSIQPPELPDLSLSYDAAACSSVPDSCGYWIGEDLLVARPNIDPEPMRVPSGGELELPAFRIVNGRSGYLFQIRCTDTPSFWGSGFLRRLWSTQGNLRSSRQS